MKELDMVYDEMARLYINQLKFDPAALVMLSKMYVGANPRCSENTDDVDELIKMAEMFHHKYKDKNWERAKVDWLSRLCEFYNKHKPFNWNSI